MRIALALSGGGFRATVFHLGVLARLAKENQLENITYLSTVSGGSLCAGLVYTTNNYKWPSSKEYAEKVLPQVRNILITKDLKHAMITRALTHIFDIAETRADDLSEIMQEQWGIDIALKDLPETPRWMINATCYETGKNWRFERFRMGDYAFGYTYDTDLPLSDAMAASAGFPGLIGALTLETSDRKWFIYRANQDDVLVLGAEESKKKKTKLIQPSYSPVHLWDGGVYDNYGLEGLHDFMTGWREDVDFLIVSDASGRSKPEAYRPGLKAMERIVTGIMMDQVIAKLDDQTFKRLYRHGYEVADYTLYAYNPDLFQYIGFGN
ncbi:MAG: patatin-like phospholipase family protein [Anaerolineae bacterium]